MDKTTQQLWPFSTDHVIRGTETMPDEQRQIVRSMYHLARQRGYTIDDVADKVGYHSRNIHKLCNGRYDGNLDQVCTAIAEWIETERDPNVADPERFFIKTQTSADIFDICTLAWQYRTVGAIWGESQMGKTHALEEFQLQHDPGVVKLIRFPAGASRMVIIRTIAEACGLPAKKGLITTVRQRIMDSIPRNSFVMWDEVHEVFLTYTRAAQLFALEFIREIHDVCKCGMMLSGTNVGRDEIEDGIDAGVFAQLRKRNPFVLQIPDYPSARDINSFADHYGLPAVPKGQVRELVTQLIQRNGLKAYTIYLESARQLAANRNEQINWSHFMTAHSLVARYAKKGTKNRR